MDDCAPWAARCFPQATAPCWRQGSGCRQTSCFIAHCLERNRELCSPAGAVRRWRCRRGLLLHAGVATAAPYCACCGSPPHTALATTPGTWGLWGLSSRCSTGGAMLLACCAALKPPPHRRHQPSPFPGEPCLRCLNTSRRCHIRHWLCRFGAPRLLLASLTCPCCSVCWSGLHSGHCCMFLALRPARRASNCGGVRTGWGWSCGVRQHERRCWREQTTGKRQRGSAEKRDRKAAAGGHVLAAGRAVRTGSGNTGKRIRWAGRDGRRSRCRTAGCYGLGAV